MATMHVYEEKRESHRIVGDTCMVNLGNELLLADVCICILSLVECCTCFITKEQNVNLIL